MPKVTKQRSRCQGKKKKPRTPGKSKEARSAWDSTESLRVNVYGRSGTGKTTFWATFPKPLLALVCSGSNKPGELKSINTPEYRKTIDARIIDRSEQVEKCVQEQQDSGKFATVVMDHATGLQELVLKEILGLEKIPQQLSWGLATREQYGQVALQMKQWLRLLLNLDCHVVIVAQEREFNSEAEGELLMPYVASALTPSVTGWLNPACDYICQTFIRQKTEERVLKIGKKRVKKRQQVKGVEYCLRAGPDSVYTTKFRVPKGTPLPEVIVDPDFDKINEIVKQGG